MHFLLASRLMSMVVHCTHERYDVGYGVAWRAPLSKCKKLDW